MTFGSSASAPDQVSALTESRSRPEELRYAQASVRCVELLALRPDGLEPIGFKGDNAATSSRTHSLYSTWAQSHLIFLGGSVVLSPSPLNIFEY